jgi:L-ascorbate metabolism protein UlaG (beta-lactamase superfamily)
VTTILDWYGCATFRLTLPGDVVVFLDAYIDRVAGAAGPQPPLTAGGIDRADWIVVGHSHFDHLWGAERIAARTGATIIGSYETVRVMADHGVPTGQLMPVAGGERIRLADGSTVSVYPSLHSCVWSHRAMLPADQVCLGDLDVVHQDRLARLADLFAYLMSLGEATSAHLRQCDQRARGDGGALLYLFETPDGSLLYQDTSGSWSSILHDLRPDVAILAAAGRANVDGEPIQGSLAGFIAHQAWMLRPQRVILSHHDDWLPGFSIGTDVAPIRQELTRRLPRCELVDLGYIDSYDVFAGLRS